MANINIVKLKQTTKKAEERNEIVESKYRRKAIKKTIKFANRQIKKLTKMGLNHLYLCFNFTFVSFPTYVKCSTGLYYYYDKEEVKEHFAKLGFKTSYNEDLDELEISWEGE